RAEFDAIAPGYEITVDTTGYVGNYELANLVAPGAADAIFLMGYDFRTSGADNAGAIAPISGEIYDVADAVRSFLRYIPPSALIVGVPYYGRAWSTVSDEPNARTQTGTRYGSSVATEYQTAATLAEENGRRYDSVEQSAWTAYRKDNCSSTYGCVTTWRELYYDDPESLGAKYDLVNQLGLRGMGIWALGYDGTRPELWDVLADKFLVPPLTLNASSDVITWASQVTLTAHLGGTIAGQQVELQLSRDNVAWLPLGRLALGPDGSVTHLITPYENCYYRAIAIDPATGLTIATSDTVRVVVRSIAIQRPLLNGVKSVALGTGARFVTTVRPARVDTPMPAVRYVVYRLLDGRWTEQTSQDVVPDASGVAVFALAFNGRGPWYVRSMALPTPFNANSSWGPVLRYNVQ
ncbi:MAG: glycoside hydrolase family 18 protein, partial [Chloroflexi bacterium]|nr:glycoside hydrolase family 18 protein [Chloroflexota bacterium]